MEMDPFARMYDELHGPGQKGGSSFRKQIAALQREREQKSISDSRRHARGERKVPIWRREVFRKEQRDREIRRQQRERDEQELGECTFTPRLSGRSQQLASAGRARLGVTVEGQAVETRPLANGRPRRGSGSLQRIRQDAPVPDGSNERGRAFVPLPSSHTGPPRARSAEPGDRSRSGNLSPPPPLGPPPPGARRLIRSPSPSSLGRKRSASVGSRSVPSKALDDIPGPGPRNIPVPAKFLAEFRPQPDETTEMYRLRLLQVWDMRWAERQADLKRLQELLRVEAERLYLVEAHHWRTKIQNAQHHPNGSRTGSPGGGSSWDEGDVAHLEDRANQTVQMLHVNAKRHDSAIDSAIQKEIDGWREQREVLDALLSPSPPVDSSQAAYYEQGQDEEEEQRTLGNSHTGRDSSISNSMNAPGAPAASERERRIAAKSAALAERRRAIENEARGRATRDAAELNRLRGAFAREVGMGKRSQAAMREDLQKKERELGEARQQWKEAALQRVAAEESDIVQERLAMNNGDARPPRSQPSPPPPPPVAGPRNGTASLTGASSFGGSQGRLAHSAPTTPAVSPTWHGDSAFPPLLPPSLGSGGRGMSSPEITRHSETTQEHAAASFETPTPRAAEGMPSPADMEAARGTIAELRRALHAEQRRSSFIHAEAEQLVAAVRDSAAAEMRSLRAEHTAEINQLQLRHEREMHTMKRKAPSKRESSIEALTQRVLQMESSQSGVSRASSHVPKEDYAASLDKFASEIASLQEMLNGLVEERNGLQAQLGDAVRERDEAKRQLSTLEEEREGWRERMREQAEQLQRLIRDLRENKARLVRSMNDLVSERDELDREREALLEREDSLYWFAKSNGMEEQWRQSGRSPPRSGGTQDTQRPPRGSVARVRRRSLTELRRDLAAQNRALQAQEERTSEVARHAVEEGGAS